MSAMAKIFCVGAACATYAGRSWWSVVCALGIATFLQGWQNAATSKLVARIVAAKQMAANQRARAGNLR